MFFWGARSLELWERVLHTPSVIQEKSLENAEHEEATGWSCAEFPRVHLRSRKKARRLLFSVLLLTCRVLAPCNYVVNAFYLCAAEALEPYRHLE